MSGDVVTIDSRRDEAVDELSPFRCNKTCSWDGVFKSPIHYFCALVDARRRRLTCVDNDFWNKMSVHGAYKLVTSDLRRHGVRIPAQDYITTMMTALWCMLTSNPRALLALIATGTSTIIHASPPIAPWSGSSTTPMEGANIAGFCMMVLRDRYAAGEAMLNPNGYSNAAAVASMHLTQMPGVALPNLTARFNPAHFPQLSNMSAAVPPTVGNGFSIKITDESSFRNVTINIPSIKDSETTSDFTQTRSATARHWKVAPTFIQGGKEAETLRFSNVRIPAVRDKTGRYGNPDGYLYASFDSFIRESLVKLVKTAIPNVLETSEKRVHSTPQHWWRTMNNVNKTIGTLSQATEFLPMNPRHIMDRTNKGIVVNGEFSVQLKASTKDGRDFDEDIPVILAIDIVRVYINKLGVDVELPERDRTVQNVLATKPIKTEVTPDDVMSQLKSLGL